MFDGVLNTSLHPSSQELFIYFQGGKFAGKNLGELRNEFLQMFSENLSNKLLPSPKKSLYIISLNKKIK